MITTQELHQLTLKSFIDTDAINAKRQQEYRKRWKKRKALKERLRDAA